MIKRKSLKYRYFIYSYGSKMEGEVEEEMVVRETTKS